MSKIKAGPSFSVSDLVYIFQIICFRETQVIEWKPEKLVFFRKSRGRINAEHKKC